MKIARLVPVVMFYAWTMTALGQTKIPPPDKAGFQSHRQQSSLAQNEHHKALSAHKAGNVEHQRTNAHVRSEKLNTSAHNTGRQSVANHKASNPHPKHASKSAHKGKHNTHKH
ncbi:MAG TPA: hypothetical protein VHX63_09065 [Acidobacteriaceae bacterium]|jgi:hypothetical protein|nr:hypothetical protein [Acidobacteriaceae bacterium]